MTPEEGLQWRDLAVRLREEVDGTARKLALAFGYGTMFGVVLAGAVEYYVRFLR